jgi:hypothetical protein
MQPRLVITERVKGIPTMGTCSACPHLTFACGEVSPTLGNMEELQRQFDEHYRQKHDGQR